MSHSITYRANGKLLLTGEYLILHGAKAIALPLKMGQQLTVSAENNSDTLMWKAFFNRQIWFSCELNPVDFSVLLASDPEKAEILSKIFQTIRKLNPEFAPTDGTLFETFLDADPEWGFGSSSTLISLLSQWTAVDPFALNGIIFKGSGFDIACAATDGPIFYTKSKPVIPVELNYPFEDQLFLVYSGKKMKTFTEVKTFLDEVNVSEELISESSDLSDEIATCTDQNEFNRLISIHENMIGKLIGKTPIQRDYFVDFDGVIKSLGAWGGDFYLVSSFLPFQEVKNYFENKGMNVVFKWKDLILKRENP